MSVFIFGFFEAKAVCKEGSLLFIISFLGSAHEKNNPIVAKIIKKYFLSIEKDWVELL